MDRMIVLGLVLGGLVTVGTLAYLKYADLRDRVDAYRRWFGPLPSDTSVHVGAGDSAPDAMHVTAPAMDDLAREVRHIAVEQQRLARLLDPRPLASESPSPKSPIPGLGPH